MVYICSPLRGDVETNIQRANRYCLFASTQAVLPLAPHTIFTQWLDDNDPQERQRGIYLGLELLRRCDELWVFGSRISTGMAEEIKLATKLGKKISYYTDRCELITDDYYKNNTAIEGEM